jgi:hypothetical protein
MEKFLKRSAPAPRKTSRVMTHRHRGGSDRRRALSVVVLSLMVAGLWWACGNSSGPSTPPMVTAPSTAPSASLVLQVTFPAIPVGGQARIMALFGLGESLKDVSSQATWSSTPTGIVSIDSTGLATGLAFGTATVTASFNGQHAATTVNVGDRLAGLVTDAASVPLPGALVSATNGGANLTMRSSNTGSFLFLTVPPGSTQVQVSADGFTPASQTITVSGDTTLNFALTPTSAPTGVAGDWQIVFSAPPDCASTLPADTRQLTFTGAIGVSNGALVLTMPNLQGPPLDPFSVDGQLFGSAVTFDLPEFTYYGSVSGLLLQQLAPTRWIGIFGTITGSLVGATIPGVITGRFDYFEVASATAFPVTPTASCSGIGTVAFTRIVPSAAHRIRR